jgi:hypothetical protein
VRREELPREQAPCLDRRMSLEALRLRLAVCVHEDLSRPRERLAEKTVREEALGLREHHVEALGRVRRPYGHDAAMVAGMAEAASLGATDARSNGAARLVQRVIRGAHASFAKCVRRTA